MIEGVRVLFGVEANIIDIHGNLDLANDVLERLDFVMAGFHKNETYHDEGIKKNTEVLIKVIQNPLVKIIYHPYALIAKVDIEKITKIAIKEKVLLELNASYFYQNKIVDQDIWYNIKLMVKILKENNKKILINSDAHSQYEVGKFGAVIEKFDELGITKDDILNNDKQAVLDFLGIKE